MKQVSILITVVIALLGTAVGYGQLQLKASNTEEKVEKVKIELKEKAEKIDKKIDSSKSEVSEKVREVKTEVKEHDDQIHELEKYSVQQTMLIERVMEQIDSTSKLLDKLDEKIEKK